MRILLLMLGGISIACISRGLRAETATEIYQRLVIPLIQSPRSSSCSECHLQGVRLDDFLTSDPKTSFASLRARGWIDTEQPSQSKLLQFIAKKPKNSTALMDQVREMELEGIGQWITASVQDPETLNIPLPELTDLKLDDSLLRHVRKDQILSRFVDVIWSQFERCANCHSPDRNLKQVEKHGDQMSWIVPNSPAETLKLLEDRKLINLETPLASLLRTKALGKDEHGGGVKFPENGLTDRQWIVFVSDYAAIQQGSYATSEEVPSFDPIRTWRTGLHLKVEELPNLTAGKYAVVSMHRIADDGRINEEPDALGEGRVSEDGTRWGTTMKLIAPVHLRQSREPVDWNSLLTAGRYQLRWIESDHSAESLENLLALPHTMQTEIDSLWETGHSAAKNIPFSAFQPVATQK